MIFKFPHLAVWGIFLSKRVLLRVLLLLFPFFFVAAKFFIIMIKSALIIEDAFSFFEEWAFSFPTYMILYVATSIFTISSSEISSLVSSLLDNWTLTTLMLWFVASFSLACISTRLWLIQKLFMKKSNLMKNINVPFPSRGLEIDLS